MSLATVVENNVLSQGDEREVRHLEFEWNGGVYQPGDVVVVQPQMPASERYIAFCDAK
jgi:sulfite reductase alpha subunit-like flavoprotein